MTATRDQVKSWIAQMSLTEKIALMSGKDFYERFLNEDKQQFGVRVYNAGGGNARLGVPELRFADGPRGVAIDGSTIFPVTIARGATWDVDLERRIGVAMGKELRALGGNLMANICINNLRHPAWGRAQETYGEDSYLLGEMGAALCTGTQSQHVIATAKHFAVNSIENARFKVDVKISERALREVYLPHFKRLVDVGVGSIMSAYNKVNGDYCAHNKHLLTDILKKEWGFEGFVHSDWVLGVYGSDAVVAGLDIENPEAIFFGNTLQNAVERGDIDESAIDDAASRILQTILDIAGLENEEISTEVICCEAHQSLAQEAAEKSIVLLKNDNVLPLSLEKVQRIAVIGRLADSVNMGDNGSSGLSNEKSMTPLAGIKRYVNGRCEVLYHDGSNLEEVALIAKAVDACIVVAGYTAADEGEYIPESMTPEDIEKHLTKQRTIDSAKGIGGDRDRLTLLPEDEELIHTVAKNNESTIVSVTAGGAVIMESWRDTVSSIVMLWYAGMRGGSALARVLFGAVSPSGKLPYTIPKTPDQLPFFDKNADVIDYDLYHGYAKFDKEFIEPAFHFGYGLSYTTFRYSTLLVEVLESTDSLNTVISVACTVSNTGHYHAEEVVQLYIGYDNSHIDRARKKLVGFHRVKLAPNETAVIEFNVTLMDLAWYCEKQGKWQLEYMQYDVFVGGSSHYADLMSASCLLDQKTIADFNMT